MANGQIKINDSIFAELLPLGLTAAQIDTLLKVNEAGVKYTQLKSVDCLLKQEIAIYNLFQDLQYLMQKDLQDTRTSVSTFKNIDERLGQKWHE